MTNEKIIFLNILKDYLNEDKSILPDDVDLSVLYDYATKHALGGVIYYQTKNKQFQHDYLSTIYRYYNRVKLLEAIKTEFNKSGLEYFLIKGTVIAELYPVPQLRTMGDSDLIVHDKKEVAGLLEQLGYEIPLPDARNEIHFAKKGVDFELHDQLLYKAKFNEEQLRQFFNNCWPYVKDNKLDDNFHFLFVIAHLRKHFLYEGVGFRLFMDLAVYAKQDLNWEWIIDKLNELQLMEFTKVCMALIKRWFNIECPIEVADISKEFYNEATDTIFENGLYKGSEAVKFNYLLAERKEKSKIAVLLSRLFPPYEDLIESKRYKFLVGRPWLLPFTWLYRFATAWKKGKECLRPVFEYDEETLKDAQQKMDDWKV